MNNSQQGFVSRKKVDKFCCSKHFNEKISQICISPACKNKKLCCAKCIGQSHSIRAHHQVISLKQFLNLYQKYGNLGLQTFHSLQQMLYQMRKKFSNKIDQFFNYASNLIKDKQNYLTNTIFEEQVFDKIDKIADSYLWGFAVKGQSSKQKQKQMTNLVTQKFKELNNLVFRSLNQQFSYLAENLKSLETSFNFSLKQWNFDKFYHKKSYEQNYSTKMEVEDTSQLNNAQLKTKYTNFTNCIEISDDQDNTIQTERNQPLKNNVKEINFQLQLKNDIKSIDKINSKIQNQNFFSVILMKDKNERISNILKNQILEKDAKNTTQYQEKNNQNCFTSKMNQNFKSSNLNNSSIIKTNYVQDVLQKRAQMKNIWMPLENKNRDKISSYKQQQKQCEFQQFQHQMQDQNNYSQNNYFQIMKSHQTIPQQQRTVKIQFKENLKNNQKLQFTQQREKLRDYYQSVNKSLDQAIFRKISLPKSIIIQTPEQRQKRLQIQRQSSKKYREKKKQHLISLQNNHIQDQKMIQQLNNKIRILEFQRDHIISQKRKLLENQSKSLQQLSNKLKFTLCSQSEVKKHLDQYFKQFGIAGRLRLMLIKAYLKQIIQLTLGDFEKCLLYCVIQKKGIFSNGKLDLIDLELFQILGIKNENRINLRQKIGDKFYHEVNLFKEQIELFYNIYESVQDQIMAIQNAIQGIRNQFPIDNFAKYLIWFEQHKQNKLIINSRAFWMRLIQGTNQNLMKEQYYDIISKKIKKQ